MLDTELGDFLQGIDDDDPIKLYLEFESDANENIKHFDETSDDIDSSVVISLLLTATTSDGTTASWPFTAEFFPDCSSISVRSNVITKKDIKPGKSDAQSS